MFCASCCSILQDHGTDDKYYGACSRQGNYSSRYSPRHRKKEHQPRRHGQLPTDLVLNVLQFVDCKQRLSSCALVACAWRAAATAATKDVQLSLCNCNKFSVDSWIEWLHKHGNEICSIDLAYECHDSVRGTYGTEYQHENGYIQINLPFKQLAGLQSLSVVKSGLLLGFFWTTSRFSCTSPLQSSWTT
jgi:hypothetical protein